MLFRKINRFWCIYFLLRLFYLFFAVFIYARITTLGDTERYLNAGFNFSYSVFFNSTEFMFCLGGLIGKLAGGANVISNFPFMLLSFYMVRWAVEKLDLFPSVNRYLLLFLISLPNFCIWTSVCSKEVFGLVFSAIFGVLTVNFLKGDYKIRKRDMLATYLCMLFKPQYFPFILQGLLFIYLARKWCGSNRARLVLGLLMLVGNGLFLFLIKDTVNEYAGLMYVHFSSDEAVSTRDNIFLNDNDFFTKAPLGMFTAFWGPTWREMMEKPTYLIAGLESLVIFLLFIVLAEQFIARLFGMGRLNVTLFFSYFIIFSGICFLHYPFGIFNPGSAIRYRTNFIFLFILLLLYCYSYYQNTFPKKNRTSAL